VKDDKPFTPENLPEHESAVRRMMADSHGASYRALKLFVEAKADPNGVVVMEGDYGGQIYLVARASYVRCSEESLQRLLSELDALEWRDPNGARLYYEVQQVGQGIPGGMGGAVVAEQLWVHSRLRHLDSAIREVLIGNANSLDDARGA
jgi:hypothetical protein